MSQLQALVSEATAPIGSAGHPSFSCARGDGGLDASWVHVAGELDLAAAEQLTEALRGAKNEARLVVLNLSQLTFLDAAGVHTIVQASIEARRDGHRLVLVAGPDHVQKMFALTGTSDQVEAIALGSAVSAGSAPGTATS